MERTLLLVFWCLSISLTIKGQDRITWSKDIVITEESFSRLRTGNGRRQYAAIFILYHLGLWLSNGKYSICDDQKF